MPSDSHGVLDCASTKYCNSVKSVGYGFWEDAILFLTLSLPVNEIPVGAWDLLLAGTCNTAGNTPRSLWLPEHDPRFPTHHRNPHVPWVAHKDTSSLPLLCLGQQGEPPAQQRPFHPGERHVWLDGYCGYWNIAGAWDYPIAVYNCNPTMVLIHHASPVPIQS